MTRSDSVRLCMASDTSCAALVIRAPAWRATAETMGRADCSPTSIDNLVSSHGALVTTGQLAMAECPDITDGAATRQTFAVSGSATLSPAVAEYVDYLAFALA